MLAVLAFPPDATAAPAGNSVRSVRPIFRVIPLLHEVRTDGRDAAVTDSTGLAALGTPRAVVASESRPGHPNVLALRTLPLHLLLVPQADLRRGLRIVFVPFPLQQEIPGDCPAAAELPGPAVTLRADLLASCAGQIADPRVPHVHLPATRTAFTL